MLRHHCRFTRTVRRRARPHAGTLRAACAARLTGPHFGLPGHRCCRRRRAVRANATLRGRACWSARARNNRHTGRGL
jgi:hypothetical protein